MYQKYQTEALVLQSRPMGEADRMYVLYTRDFGLIRARASGARKETSKMRYALQHYSRATVGLIRGVRGWRLAGAIALETSARKDTDSVRVFARLSDLVAKLVIGEEENPYLYEALSQTYEALIGGWEGQTFPSPAATIEIVAVARILYALGYISSEALKTALFTHTAYALEHLIEAESIREDLLLSINRALSETHL
ncbi:recombination protein O N-terminal domain-containing protein [Candidatus Kaiserbacteria bacterium]|nr:recombination protein O N-terminal domain-containing protein [Candidatus Kaiserbacteria bacterium]